jgi:hypothetical protein
LKPRGPHRLGNGSALSTSKMRAVTWAGRCLVAADSLHRRYARRVGGRRETAAAPTGGPSGVLVAVSHWRGPADVAASAKLEPATAAPRSSRARILMQCVEAVLALGVDRVVVAVITNAPAQTARALAAHFDHGARAVPVMTLPGVDALKGRVAAERQIFVIGWKPRVVRRHGYNLTWAHKRLFRRVLDDQRFSHLVYLEDDIRFTQQSFSYWCRYRAALAAHGLMPGFVRYESTPQGRVVADQTSPQPLDGPRVHVAASGAEGAPASDALFVALDNAYQGMYVLDRSLARSHFRYSPNRTPLRSQSVQHWVASDGVAHWGWRERAAAGPIFDDVPSGFAACNVVLVRNDGETGDNLLDPACLIEHLSESPTRSPNSPFGRIRVEDLFLS